MGSSHGSVDLFSFPSAFELLDSLHGVLSQNNLMSFSFIYRHVTDQSNYSAFGKSL
jgi:hypothetical protein